MNEFDSFSTSALSVQKPSSYGEREQFWGEQLMNDFVQAKVI